jgi:DNA modification methylase
LAAPTTPKTPTALQIVQVPIDALRPDPANPRRISDAELDALTRSLRAFGFVQPVLARHEDHVVIGGHQRLVAARRIGLKTVPVLYLDISLEQARLLNLALNRISGTWDDQLLGQLLADLSSMPEVDLSLSGFEDAEITSFLKRIDAAQKRDQVETFDVDAALGEAERTPITQPGDLWLLGDHRLLCGDSTSESDVARLFAGQQAVLMATDPPYLVDYTGGEHPPRRANAPATRNKHWDAYKDPEASVSFFADFLRVALQHLVPDAAIYQWHATRRQALLEAAWVQNRLLVHQTIIWVKASGVLTRSHYLWSHEPCFYGWVEGHTPKRKPPPNQRTIWEVGQHGEQLGIHPTQKPVELFVRPIESHTRPGEIVYEPFSGWGMQLIAAERTGRLCYAIDREPTYVDVAVKRGEAFSGKSAVREQAGADTRAEERPT